MEARSDNKIQVFFQVLRDRDSYPVSFTATKGPTEPASW